MSRLLCFVGLALGCVVVQAAEDPIFSGPQIGETLPGLPISQVLGDNDGEDVDVIEKAGDDSVLLFFVHQRTRPAFGLTNTIAKYAVTREGLACGIVFLTADPTATTNWMKQVKRYFPEGATMGVSKDGVEGPGSYGLNRNVTLTVLVAKEGKVTANFALVQPSLQADGPKILKAIADVSEGGDPPTIEELAPERYMARNKRNMRAQQGDARSNDARGNNAREERDPQLAGMLRSVINKQASEEQVAEAAKKVETYVEENEAARKQLGEIAGRIVNSDRLPNYGTAAAQELLKKWAKAYGKKSE